MQGQPRAKSALSRSKGNNMAGDRMLLAVVASVCALTVRSMLVWWLGPLAECARAGARGAPVLGA